MSGGLAIISGGGELPRLIAQKCREAGRNYRVVTFGDVKLDWLDGHPHITAAFETLGPLFSALSDANCDEVVFAGAMKRPSLDPDKFDADGIALASILLSKKATGDDATLRAITAFFESHGFQVVGAHKILTNLLPTAGVLSDASPNAADIADTARAVEIVNVLGKADVGQGAVVAQGICLALESIQGTDEMLRFVANTRGGFTPNPKGGKGILLKAPKPNQDLRVDLPAIGPETIRSAANAGLAGVVITAGGVMVLDLATTISEADRLGVFLWVKPGV